MNAWAQPAPQPCPVFRAWVGVCGETDRRECKHFTYSEFWPRCRCGRPALSECSSASSLVCGRPICHTGECGYHSGGYGKQCSPEAHATLPETIRNPSYRP